MPTIRRLSEWLTSAARANPAHPALIAADAGVTYSELDRLAAQRAAALAGPHAVTLEPVGLDFAVLLHAAARAGVPFVPLNPQLERPPIPADLPAGTLALLFTSGTTGEPRPVALSRAHFEASARATHSRLEIRPGDRWLCCLAGFHVAGLSILTRCAIHGATAVLEPRFDAQRVRALLEAGEATLVSLVPTMLARLREAGFERAPGLRGMLLGGGPIPDELFEWAREAGLPVMATYGMTETASQVALSDPGRRAARVLDGAEIQIAADGEILVRGPMVAADGWLHTGDRGRLTGDGLLEVEGRMDELIVTGGENVAAREVEEALRSHPGVEDVAVIGLPDPEWGRAVTAFVVGSAGEEELRAHARERLAGFKVPKRVVSLAELPRTASGKVRRGQLARLGAAPDAL